MRLKFLKVVPMQLKQVLYTEKGLNWKGFKFDVHVHLKRYQLSNWLNFLNGQIS